VPVDEYLPTIISLEDQDRVIARIPAERRGAFLAARLGLRPSEVRALNMEDYREGCLVVAHGMKGPSSYHPRRGTKSRRFRFVEVDRELADWITEYRRDAIGAAPLFVNPTGAEARGGGWEVHYGRSGTVRRGLSGFARACTKAQSTAARVRPRGVECGSR